MNFLSKLKGILTQSTDSEDTLTTKSYVDGKVAKAGDTMTGELKVKNNVEAESVEMRQQGKSGQREQFLHLSLTNDNDSRFDIFNETTGANEFRPGFQGYKRGSSNLQAPLTFYGSVDGAADSGSEPLIRFMGLKRSGDPLSGSNTNVSTRPIVSFRNYHDSYLDITANGRLGVGTSAPTQKLDVNGKIRMQTQPSEDDGEDIVATKGYVDSRVSSIDIEDTLGYTPVDKAGDTMTGPLVIDGVNLPANANILTLKRGPTTNRFVLETQNQNMQAFLEAGGSIGLMGTITESDFRIRTNYKDRVTVGGSNGYVGINNTSPTQALDVDGKIRMRTQTAPADNDDIVATKKYVDDNKYTHPAVNHIPASGSSGQFLGWDSSGKAKWVDAPSGGGPASEMVGKSTTFNSNGNITENYANGDVMLTIFNSNGSITEEFTPSGGTKITKTTTFNQDGSIDEVIT